MQLQHNKIIINKNHWKEAFFGLIFILPYIEPFIGGTWRIENIAVGRAIIIVECIIVLWCFVKDQIVHRRIKIWHGLELCFIVYALALMLIITPIEPNNVTTALWMTIPLLCAIALDNRIYYERIDYSRVMYYGILYFTAYTIVLFLFNIYVLEIMKTGHRLVAIAGGSVIFGYTLAVYFALLIANKKMFHPIVALVIKVIFTVIAVFTGSRGGVWPIVLLWIYDALLTKFTKKRLIVFAVAFLLLIIINPLEYVYELMPRLLSMGDSARFGSNSHAITAFQSFDFSQKIMGYGPGEFFPYQAWVNKNVSVGGNAFARNSFIFNGTWILVQPHNVYLYYLLEVGLIGSIMLLGTVLMKINLRNARNRGGRLALIGTIIIVNFFDSVMIVEPGVGFIMWFFILSEYSKDTRSK